MADERKLNGSPSINKDYYYYYYIILDYIRTLLVLLYSLLLYAVSL